MWCRRLRLIDIVTKSVVCYCYCEHTYVFIYLYVLIRSDQTNIKHLSNKQQTLIWEVPLASIKCIILFWYKNELVTQELDTVHLDASSHQSIGRRMKTSVTTESKKKKINRNSCVNTWVAMAQMITTAQLHKNFQIKQTQLSHACFKPIWTT